MWFSDGPPPPPTGLELLADAAGVDYWQVREWLRREVSRRRRDAVGATAPPIRTR